MKSKKHVIIYALMMTCMIITGTVLGYGAAVITQQMNQPMPSPNLPDINLVKDRLGLSLTILDGVTGIGIGENNGIPCIIVDLVNDSADLKAKIPTQAERYQIITEVTGPITASPALIPVLTLTGGMRILTDECVNCSTRNDTAEYIIEGTVVNIESDWNVTNGYIITDIHIENYVRGTPFEVDDLKIIAPGGTFGNTTMWVEGIPSFYIGEHLRLYLIETQGELSILCDVFGVEEL